METLAARIARNGALKDTDAVGWAIRLSKNVERMHAIGHLHGHISPRCLRIAADACTSGGELLEPGKAPYLLRYHSPERAGGEGPSTADDTWAIAVTLYEALTGAPPFQGASDAEIVAQIQSAPVPQLAGVGDAALQATLDKALARDAQRRIVDVATLRRMLEAWRPSTRPARLPALEERAIPRIGGDEEEDPEAVTRIRGDIAPVLQDLIQLASVSPESPPESTRGGAPRSRPGEASAPASSKRVSPQSPITALAGLGLRQNAPPSSGTAGPPSSQPRAGGLGTQRSTEPSAIESAPASSRATASSRTPAFGSALAYTAHAPDDDEEDVAPTSLRAMPPSEIDPFEADTLVQPKLSREPPAAAEAPADARPSRESLTDADTVVHMPPSGLSSSEADASGDAATLARGEPPGFSAGGEAPAPGSELPGLLDEESHAEPENLFAVPGAWTKLDVPARASGSDRPPSELPAANSADPPQVGASAAPEPAAPSGRRWGVIGVFVAAAVIGGGVMAWLFTRTPPGAGGAPAATQAAPPAPAAPTGRAASSVAAVVPSSTASAQASAPAASAAPTASAAPAAPAAPPAATAASAEGMDACMTPMFPPGTFASQAKPDFAFVCGETDPRRGAGLLKKHVVLGAPSKFVSDAMREWALLGWYELATFAVMRAECCPSPAPLELPPSPESCGRLDKALDVLGAAGAKATGPEDPALEAAMKGYTDAVSCLARASGTSVFGYTGAPKGGEETAFRKILGRVTGKP